MEKEKIFYQKDQAKDRLAWIQGLNASGYAGIKTPEGWIVDRREFPDSIPVQGNPMFGVAEPKTLEAMNICERRDLKKNNQPPQ